jgi:TctA family transporter
MEAFSQLLNGFAVALTPINLLWCLVGTTLGTAIGVLPAWSVMTCLRRGGSKVFPALSLPMAWLRWPRRKSGE